MRGVPQGGETDSETGQPGNCRPVAADPVRVSAELDQLEHRCCEGQQPGDEVQDGLASTGGQRPEHRQDQQDHGRHGTFDVGDEVVGLAMEDVSNGTYAELVTAPAAALVSKPGNMEFTTAAAVPLAGLTAAQAVSGEGLAISSGETVLVHAAAGGVGTFAVQLARRTGARVIGTASPRNADYLRSLGAEPVEYGDGLVERVRELAPDGVDAALDLAGREALDQSAELLRDPLRLISAVDPRVFQLGGRMIQAHPNRGQLEELLDLVSKGDVHVEIAEVLPLDRVARAHDVIAEGHVRGKLVLDLTA